MAPPDPNNLCPPKLHPPPYPTLTPPLSCQWVIHVRALGLEAPACAQGRHGLLPGPDAGRPVPHRESRHDTWNPLPSRCIVTMITALGEIPPWYMLCVLYASRGSVIGVL